MVSGFPADGFLDSGFERCAHSIAAFESALNSGAHLGEIFHSGHKRSFPADPSRRYRGAIGVRNAESRLHGLPMQMSGGTRGSVVFQVPRESVLERLADHYHELPNSRHFFVLILEQVPRFHIITPGQHHLLEGTPHDLIARPAMASLKS